MFTIELDELEGVGLIIAHPSGVEYTNQVGGYACLHPKLEGVLVPLITALPAPEELYAHFTGPKWKGHCYEGIDAETADFIDGLLCKYGWDGPILVDRERMAESYEAWIRVKVGLNGSHWHGDFQGGAGVLTWENSD